MERFERATKFAKKLKIDSFIEVEEIVDKHMKLFEYYYVSKDLKNAKIEYYFNIRHFIFRIPRIPHSLVQCELNEFKKSNRYSILNSNFKSPVVVFIVVPSVNPSVISFALILP